MQNAFLCTLFKVIFTVFLAVGRGNIAGFKKPVFKKKAQPTGFLGFYLVVGVLLGFIGFFGQAGKTGKIIQKLSNLKP